VLSPLENILNKGNFSTDFCKSATSFLSPKDTASLTERCKTNHAHLTMRLPTEGSHPVLDGAFKSVMESKFYDAEHDRIQSSVARVNTQAKAEIAKYLPINNANHDRAAQINNIVGRYQAIAGKIAVLDVKTENLHKKNTWKNASVQPPNGRTE
jgi:hypothetical protein